jgi:hypothetical protein
MVFCNILQHLGNGNGLEGPNAIAAVRQTMMQSSIEAAPDQSVMIWLEVIRNAPMASDASYVEFEINLWFAPASLYLDRKIDKWAFSIDG